MFHILVQFFSFPLFGTMSFCERKFNTPAVISLLSLHKPLEYRTRQKRHSNDITKVSLKSKVSRIDTRPVNFALPLWMLLMGYKNLMKTVMQCFLWNDECWYSVSTTVLDILRRRYRELGKYTCTFWLLINLWVGKENFYNKGSWSLF